MDCNIGAKDISDHAGVYLTLHLDTEPKTALWRLKTSLLNDSPCERFVKDEFKDSNLNNYNKIISPSTLWDAVKAILRGKLIMWSMYKKKEKERQITDLTNTLKSLENYHIIHNDAETNFK